MSLEHMQGKTPAIKAKEARSSSGSQTEVWTDERSEAGKTEGKAPLDGGTPEIMPAPDPEVVASGRRRRYSASYKAKVLAKADACEPGEVGAMLRREGLYRSTLHSWRKQREKAILSSLTPKKRGPVPDSERASKQRLAQLEKENQRLSKLLAHAELIIDVQKKVAMLLGQPLTASEQKKEEQK